MESCWSGREQLHTGDMLNRLEEDVQTITDALCRMLPAVFITCFQLLGALYFLSYLDMRLTIVLVLSCLSHCCSVKDIYENAPSVARDTYDGQ